MAQTTARKRSKPWNKGKKLHSWGTVPTHRRRTNPAGGTMVLLANPHRRRRRHKAKHVVKPTVKRRRVWETNPQRASTRRRRSSHHVAHVMRSRGIRRHRVHANPIMGFSWIAIAKMFVFGTLGIIVARVVGNFYDDSVSDKVLGEEGRADPKSWRGILNEFVRTAIQGAAIVVIGRAMKKAGIGGENAAAFTFAGLGETGRELIGRGVRLMSPTTNTKQFGLDGPEAIEEPNGQVWVLNEATGRYQLAERTTSLSGIEPAVNFEGFIENEDMFAPA